MKSNTAQFLPAPRGSAVRVMLVLMVGLFGLAWLLYENSQANPLLPFREQIATAKAWVKMKSRDPSSVTFHHVAVGGDETPRVYLDFSWNNEPGGTSRQRWRFEFTRNSNALQVVKEDDSDKVVALEGKTLVNMRALQAGDEKTRQAQAEARAARVLMGEGAQPFPQTRSAVPANALPPVPGLGR